MTEHELAQEILGGLAAYGKQYELPEAPPQLEAIIGSLINVKLEGANQTLSPKQITKIVKLVKADFDPQSVGQTVLDEAKQTLATQAHQWRQDLQQQVEGVLNAYVQQYSTDLNTDALKDLVTAVAPMVKSGQATKPEVIGLAQQMMQTFAPDSALSTVVNPTFLGLAQDLATVLSQKDAETAVSETVTAYVEKFSPAVEAIGENLIENALGAILKNQIEFGLDTDLNLAQRQLIIQQVSFKLNIMEQSPVPSKPAELMAAQLNAEIERFKAERRRQAGILDITEGRLSNNGLSISSNWVFTDPTPNGDATED